MVTLFLAAGAWYSNQVKLEQMTLSNAHRLETIERKQDQLSATGTLFGQQTRAMVADRKEVQGKQEQKIDTLTAKVSDIQNTVSTLDERSKMIIQLLERDRDRRASRP